MQIKQENTEIFSSNNNINHHVNYLLMLNIQVLRIYDFRLKSNIIQAYTHTYTYFHIDYLKYFLFLISTFVLDYVKYNEVATMYGIARFCRSIRGNVIIKLDGQSFTLNRRRYRTSYWECFKKRSKNSKCNARIITVDDVIKTIRGIHNHS